MNGFVRLYDVSRHEPRLICPPNGTMRTGYDLVDNFGEFIAIKASATGTHLCMLIATENLLPDGKLYLWNVQEDHLSHFDFFNSAHSDKFFTKLPVNFHWDCVDQRLLAVEVKCIQQKGATTVDRSQVGRVVTESQVLVMFVAEKATLKELEVIRLVPAEQLVNLCVPHVVSRWQGSACRAESNGQLCFQVTLKINEIGRIALRDFKGLENCDQATRQMVLDFSLNVAQGNMDQAFR